MMILRFLASLLTVVIAVAAAAASSSVITVYTWPLSASSPTPFAEINLPSTAGGVAEVRSKSNPKIVDGELVRVGLLDDNKAWSGVATSADSFKSGINQKLVLHTGSDGQVAHIGFSSFLAKKDSKEDALQVEIVPIEEGAKPILNKPVVLNAEGKLDTPTGDNKTFLQKYWWAIALFLVVQVFAGGGKE